MSPALLLFMLGSVAVAAPPIPDRAALAAEAAKRFPQPVRVGDLIGRDVLQPKEAQPVLGRVDAVVRRADGAVDLVLRHGGVLGFGARLIAIPVEAAALLGEHVAIVGLTPEQLDALPPADGGAGALPGSATIGMALVRPFH